MRLGKEWGKVKCPILGQGQGDVWKVADPMGMEKGGKEDAAGLPSCHRGHRGQVTSNVAWKDKGDASETRT